MAIEPAGRACGNHPAVADGSPSACDAGSCSPCQTNDDCSHLTDTTVCDVDAGQCVQCTVAEEAVCGGTSCNPATNTCTNTELGSVGSCEPCVADSECIGNDQSGTLTPLRADGIQWGAQKPGLLSRAAVSGQRVRKAIRCGDTRR